MTTTTNTVNQMKFKTVTKDRKGNTLEIVISLADECKNGHNDFHITGTSWEKGKPLTDRYFIQSGSIGDEIIKSFPEYTIFEQLHGCDYKGAPMYAEANGFYHLKNSSKTVVMDYLRITESEYYALVIAEDQTYFTYLLQGLAIPERWQKEALKAIEVLEGLTGCKFEDNSTRSQFTPLSSEQIAVIETRIKEGYYLPNNIEKRRLQAIEDKKQKAITELNEDLSKSIKKHTDEHSVKMAVLLADLPIDNLIYYNHTNTAVFNWQDSAYKSKLSAEQFNSFIESVDMTKLPEGIKFELK